MPDAGTAREAVLLALLGSGVVDDGLLGGSLGGSALFGRLGAGLGRASSVAGRRGLVGLDLSGLVLCAAPRRPRRQRRPEQPSSP